MNARQRELKRRYKATKAQEAVTPEIDCLGCEHEGEAEITIISDEVGGHELDEDVPMAEPEDEKKERARKKTKLTHSKKARNRVPAWRRPRRKR